MEVWMGTSAKKKKKKTNIKVEFLLPFLLPCLINWGYYGVLPCCHVPWCPCVAACNPRQAGCQDWMSVDVRWTAIAVVCCGKCSAKWAMLWAPWFFHILEPFAMVGPILYGLAWLSTQVLRSYGLDVCVSTFKLDWHPGSGPGAFTVHANENHLKCEMLGQEQ